MKILFAGSPVIAVPSLAALVALQLERSQPQIEVCALLTNPDTSKGRSAAPSPTALSAAAAVLSGQLAAQGFPPIVQFKPPSLKDRGAMLELARIIPDLGIDLLVSFAYGKMFSEPFLALFPQGGVNVHPSLLPEYRGATPLQQAILEGNTVSGITIQRLAAAMDSGAILAQERFPLTGTETTASLSAFAGERAAALLSTTVSALATGIAQENPQEEERATWCAKINKEDGVIDWRKSARAIDAQVRAFTPWPLSWTYYGGRELYILEGAALPLAGTAQTGIIRDAPAGFVQCADKKSALVVQTGDGLFTIMRLQFKAKKALDWRDFLNGARLKAGDTLGF